MTVLPSDRLKSLPCVVICAGPPDCIFEGHEAVKNAEDGCPLCTRVAVDRAGEETYYHLPAH